VLGATYTSVKQLLTSLAMPSLVMCHGDLIEGCAGSRGAAVGSPAGTSVSVPRHASVGGVVVINVNAMLTTLAMPLLEHADDHIVGSHPALTSTLVCCRKRGWIYRNL
jgi:hypothetical protein